MTHLVERSHDASLYHGPETFDGIGMDRAIHILTHAMVNHTVRETGVETAIAPMVVRRDQTNLMRDRFVYEAGQCPRIDTVDYSRNDVAFALDCADNNRFAMSARAAEVSASARSFVLVLCLPADVGFVNLDVADQLFELGVAKRNANLAAHEPRGLVPPKA